MTDAVARWRGPQDWRRDGTEPALSLGAKGTFDDMHIFAPCVAQENGEYRMWYAGSRGEVARRVFAVGLATSRDGVRFERYAAAPVLSLGDGERSVLTPTLLRNADGSLCREGGRLRMWFSCCDFPSGNPLHTLHESASGDGIAWDDPSGPELENVYAPTVIKEGSAYRMWYSDVSADPWCIRRADSGDGRRWTVAARPALELWQAWERRRLFYPTVVKADGVYLMWYGSYRADAAEMKTSLGFAVSRDGCEWEKAACNPVFGPDASREWESHFTTSQTVLRDADGTWRMWYATRTRPPFVHKYFAIGAARWHGPASA